MDGDIHDWAKIGLVHCLAYYNCIQGTGPIYETVSATVADPFFEAIEITQISDPNVRAMTAQVLKQSRIDAFFCAQPMLFLNKLDLEDPDEKNRQTAVAMVQSGIDQAQQLGCVAVSLVSGQDVPPGQYPAAFARLVDSVMQLCAYGASKGLSLNIESFDQDIYGKDCLIGTTEEASALIDAVRRSYPDFGLLLDEAHLRLLGESPAAAFRLAGDRLVHVHLANAYLADPSSPYYGDEHPYFGLEGSSNGTEQVAETLAVLLELGYLSKTRRNVVSFEIRPNYAMGDTSEAIIAGAKRTLTEAWKLV